MYSDDNIKRERIQIYFDILCGITCSISALIGIFFFFLPERGVVNLPQFVIGVIFWIGYLCLSIFLIGLGIFTHYKEKNFSPDDPKRKKLKAPMVS